MNEFQKLNELMEMDELSFRDLAIFCVTAYRMSVNPMPILRNYFALSKTTIPAHYIETECSVNYEEILTLTKSKASELIIVNAIKREGLVRTVNIFHLKGSMARRIN